MAEYRIPKQVRTRAEILLLDYFNKQYSSGETGTKVSVELLNLCGTF